MPSQLLRGSSVLQATRVTRSWPPPRAVRPIFTRPPASRAGELDADPWRGRASCDPTDSRYEEVKDMTLEQLDAIDTNADAAEMAASLGSQSC